MPAAAGTKKYVVTAAEFAIDKTKGMHIFVPNGKKTPSGEPDGEQVYVEVGKTVELTPEQAQPLVDIGRLRPVAEG